jgi:3-deoxy-manno-octulosonate cytidylyltransferase (CMP-KDO synthetase)
LKKKVAEFLGIIPARYASTRFPGKPLAMLGDKPMIQWVYERASDLFEHLLVATDDPRIVDAVLGFGGKVVMTSEDHRSGTERCAEAAGLYEEQKRLKFSHVVNIQGDEPLIQTDQVRTLLDCFKAPETQIATLIREISGEEDLKNPNVVKVVVDQSFRALYFSRSAIPFIRESGAEQVPRVRFYSHIGLYGFRREVLEQVVRMPPTNLEQAESLEQLRWLEHGKSIQTALTNLPSLGVDTPEDLDRLRKKAGF